MVGNGLDHFQGADVDRAVVRAPAASDAPAQGALVVDGVEMDKLVLVPSLES
jgi:hypothetical protein